MGENVMEDFDHWFKKITQHTRYDFQKNFATSPQLPHLVRVPTGCGKTDMILLGWLWRRIASKDQALLHSTPRRLVYCLPMRVLVEQTYQTAKKHIEKSGLQDLVQVYQLMGGEIDNDYIRHPERDCILIGTQDLLLSRALNRGYAASRYRWPMDFGLLNNDCLWVLDEVQLMDAGLATSTQLDGFRQKLKVFHSAHTVWMSATLREDWLETVDLDRGRLDAPLELSDNDRQNEDLNQRYEAVKRLNKTNASIGEEKALAKEILDAHKNESNGAPIRTLAVINTVDRAINVYKEIKKITKNEKIKLVLIHSRFRPEDRKQKLDQLLEEPRDGGTIVIATQVIEAGVDVSSKVLFTELAPWASLVQRFGRCNRRGEYNPSGGGSIYWLDLPENEKEQKKNAPPYEMTDLLNARKLIDRLQNAGPASLKQLQDNHPEEYQAAMRFEHTHVIRRKDLLDLFDTTPDLAGNDIDVSRFIRSGEELDVHVFWRHLHGKDHPDPENDSGKAPHRNELCPVPINKFKDFLKNKKEKKEDVWRWDPLSRKWISINQTSVYPGQTFLIRCDAGGYDPEKGWNEKSNDVVHVIEIPLKNKTIGEGYDDDHGSQKPLWLTISQHTDEVVQCITELADALGIDREWKDSLLLAARWHDRGKAHPIFQDAIHNRTEPWKEKRDLAKAPAECWGRYSRKRFRHELASALAMLQEKHPDLAVYLAASHHGKVRLSIRSLPEETPPNDPQTLFARGIYDGDELPPTDLGGGAAAGSVTLSLECMQLGRSENNEPSWVERMLRLRDELGPFRLAFLEAVFRAADWRASKEVK
ncbi:MAG: type I-G CRISPR-associated helicase/endonuclease Cas3g, partial [Candidatus Hinthialibacter sp.]